MNRTGTLVFLAVACIALTANAQQTAWWQSVAANQQPAPDVRAPVSTASDAEEPIPLPPVSDQPAGMSLADLQQIALANNPTLVQAATQVEAAQGRWVQAGLYPNPTLFYSGFEIGDGGRAGQQGALVDQPIVIGGKLKWSQAAASREITQAQQEFEAQRLRVMTDVRLAYYNVLVTQRMVELAQQLVSVGDQGLSATDKLLRAKEAGRVDFLQSRVEANAAKIALQNAENRQRGAWRRLTTIVGQPCLPPAPLIGDLEKDLPQLNWDESSCRLMASSPEILAARAGVERAQYTLRRAQVEPIPNLQLQAGPSYDFATGDAIANVQMGVTLPLHDNNRGNIRAAEAQLGNAQAEVVRVELSLQNRLATAFVDYENARQQVEKYSKEILPDARSSLDLVARGYRQGEFNYLTLLTAQRTFFQTNLAYVAAVSALWENSVAIEGMLLTDSLRTTNPQGH